MNTVEQIVKKDFAMDGDELKMRTAAHQLLMSLTAGLTLINCRDHLTLSISSNIQASMLSTVRVSTLLPGPPDSVHQQQHPGLNVIHSQGYMQCENVPV